MAPSPGAAGPLFDKIGRKPMISGTYILSGALLLVPPGCSARVC